MTREEAIKRLEIARTNALIQKANGASEYWQEEIDGTIESVDMAIEALSAEASEDTISREYLLSKVYDMDNDNLVVDYKDIVNAPSVSALIVEG